MASSSGRAQPTVQMCVGVSMRGQLRRLGAGLTLDLQAQMAADLDRAHAVAFGVALECVHVAAIKIRAFLEDGEHHPIAVGHLLDVEIAAMGAVVDGEHAAGDRRHADDADHRLGFELQRVAPMDDAVLDPHVAVLDAELLAADPVREDADARPERGEAQAVDADFDHLDGQHVAGLGAADADRAGRGVDEGQRDVGQA